MIAKNAVKITNMAGKDGKPVTVALGDRSETIEPGSSAEFDISQFTNLSLRGASDDAVNRNPEFQATMTDQQAAALAPQPAFPGSDHRTRLDDTVRHTAEGRPLIEADGSLARVTEGGAMTNAASADSEPGKPHDTGKSGDAKPLKGAKSVDPQRK